jgi:solute carrier family 35 protein C2
MSSDRTNMTPNMRTAVTSTLAILFYFIASTSLTMFNKWFFGEHHGNADAQRGRISTASPNDSSFLPMPPPESVSFRYPLTVTCIHQMLVFFLILLFENNLLRRFAGEVKKDRRLIFSIGVIGAMAGMDWGLSNTSLKTIPLSLYEMVKSCSPMCVLVLGSLLGIVRLTIPLVFVIVLLCVGMFLSVSGGDVSVLYSADFPFAGFVLVCGATVLSGIRVLMAQRVLHGVPGSSEPAGVNSVTLLYYSTPASALFLVVPAFVVEGAEVTAHWRAMTAEDRWFVAWCILASSSIAFCLSFSEYLVTRLTSALTLCVTGITKQCFIVALAMALFHEKLAVKNALGFGLTIAGIALYNWLKWHQGALQSAGGGGASASVVGAAVQLPACSPVLDIHTTPLGAVTPVAPTQSAFSDIMLGDIELKGAKASSSDVGGARSIFSYQRVPTSEEESSKSQ